MGRHFLLNLRNHVRLLRQTSLMRILHTSDWHLGRGLSGYDLADAQIAAIHEMIDAAISEQVELFLIAGDIFDRTIPGVEDIKIFNDALHRLNAAGIPTVVTSGNHDQGARLAAYSGLLTENLWIIGRTEDTGRAIELADAHGPVVIYPIPYLDPDTARHILKHEDGTLLERSHDGVYRVVMERIRADFQNRKAENSSVRAVVMAHAFVARLGAPKEELEEARCESQRDIAVGGLEIVNATHFADMNYVALGHLHGGREVQHSLDSTHIRYSGSILRYSLSELKHEKSYTIVELDEAGVVTESHLQVRNITQPRGMADLQGTLEELLSDEFAKHHEDFVRLVVMEEKPAINYYAQLENRFKFIVSHAVKNPKAGETDAALPSVQRVDELQPLTVMESFFEFSRGHTPDDAQVDLMQKYLEKAQKELGAQ